MTEKDMWNAYTRENPCCKEAHYDAWCYGSSTPDFLAKLTLAGTKTATASAYPMYQYEQCELPQVGEYNLILDTSGAAVCITKTTCVTVVPFRQVTAEHAYKEGEGDRSLSYWRAVHATVFTAELHEINLVFSEDMLVVCQEFEVVYPHL